MFQHARALTSLADADHSVPLHLRPADGRAEAGPDPAGVLGAVPLPPSLEYGPAGAGQLDELPGPRGRAPGEDPDGGQV